VTFRYLPPDASASQSKELNLALVQALIKHGYAMLTSTQLADRTVLRFCTINPRTTQDDLVRTIEVLDELYADLIA
jgi:aromatic-L-amino-acid decarboxylase